MLLIVLLYIAGIILFLAEFFLPGLVLGIVGALMLIASAGLVFYHDPQHAGLILVAQAVGVIIALVVGLWVFLRTGMSRGLTLSKSQEEAAGYTNQISNRSLIG
ncbi:MAG: hypothetical protein IT368_00535, partial [Candidatus Hydrogenedentes bacterium]|nr:hypothetical protein [Candidatus Hydrogenedentota bacterium]